MSCSILIIEDEALIAQEISHRLKDLGYKVEKIIARSDAAIEYLSFHTPDLVLCDIMIKGSKDGIEVAQIIREKKEIPFVFLTSLSDRSTIERAKQALPYGYIIKPFDEKDLLSSIEIALYKFQEEINALRITKEKVDTLGHTPLTKQEYEVLLKMVKGGENSEMAKDLFISTSTVKFHARNIYAKLEVKGRTEMLQLLLKRFAKA